jgi:SSS family solute:Na+ symporter
LLALRAARTAQHGDADYYLAGRTLGPWVVALSAVASGRSAWLLLGMSYLAYTGGMAAVWFLPGYIIAELLMFLGAGRRLREATGAAGDVTLGDYFSSRFPAWGRALQLVYALTVIFFLSAYISAQLIAGAKGMASAFAMEMGAGIIFTAAIVLFYVVVGGFRAVSWTDVAQVALMMLALVVLPITAAASLDVMDSLGEMRNPFWKGGPYILTGLAVGLGSPGNPHILVRYMSVRDPADLKRAAIVGTAWNVIMGVGALAIGLCAYAHFAPGEVGKETAFPQLAAAYLHPLLFGLVMAALLAAIMSTVDSQVLVAASAFSCDLRRVFGWRRVDGRIVSAVLIAVATGVAFATLAGPESSTFAGLINNLVLFAWGGLGAAFGPALLLSLYDKRATGLSTLAAMITGGVVACLWKGWIGAHVSPWIRYELTVAFPAALAVGWLLPRVTGSGNGSESAPAERRSR